MDVYLNNTPDPLNLYTLRDLVMDPVHSQYILSDNISNNKNLT